MKFNGKMMNGRKWAISITLAWFAIAALSTYERLIPGSAYLTVGSVQVSDTAVGTPPKMNVYREIHREFEGKWIADVEKLALGPAGSPRRYTVVCTGAGENIYSPDNALPEDLDLNWWTFPVECTPKVPGTYRVSTTWSINTNGGLKAVRSVSNNFIVTGPRQESQ